MTSYQERSFTNSVILYQRATRCDKVLCVTGKSFTEIRDDLHKVYGNSCLANSTISKWMRRFKKGRESTEDDKHTGRPVTITTEKKDAEIQEFIL